MWAGALRETLQDPPSEVRLSPGRRCVPLEQELGLGSGQLPKQWVKPCTAEISALGQPGEAFPSWAGVGDRSTETLFDPPGDLHRRRQGGGCSAVPCSGDQARSSSSVCCLAVSGAVGDIDAAPGPGGPGRLSGACREHFAPRKGRSAKAGDSCRSSAVTLLPLSPRGGPHSLDGSGMS